MHLRHLCSWSRWITVVISTSSTFTRKSWSVNIRASCGSSLFGLLEESILSYSSFCLWLQQTIWANWIISWIWDSFSSSLSTSHLTEFTEKQELCYWYSCLGSSYLHTTTVWITILSKSILRLKKAANGGACGPAITILIGSTAQVFISGVHPVPKSGYFWSFSSSLTWSTSSLVIKEK